MSICIIVCCNQLYEKALSVWKPGCPLLRCADHCLAPRDKKWLADCLLPSRDAAHKRQSCSNSLPLHTCNLIWCCSILQKILHLCCKVGPLQNRPAHEPRGLVHACKAVVYWLCKYLVPEAGTDVCRFVLYFLLKKPTAVAAERGMPTPI